MASCHRQKTRTASNKPLFLMTVFVIGVKWKDDCALKRLRIDLCSHSLRQERDSLCHLIARQWWQSLHDRGMTYRIQCQCLIKTGFPSPHRRKVLLFQTRFQRNKEHRKWKMSLHILWSQLLTEVNSVDFKPMYLTGSAVPANQILFPVLCQHSEFSEAMLES